jgi:predicted DNA-binding helix-hairpin-helix protein
VERGVSLEQKIDLLMALAVDDQDGMPGRTSMMPPPGSTTLPPRLRHAGSVGALRPLNIRTVRDSQGRRATLLRILMTNACSFNCHYCPMRRDRDMPRTLLKPEELVRIFLGAHARGWCSGLFITTGIPGRPVKVMDDLITVLTLLRERHRFAGYIHVKMVPGGDAEQIARLTALATRVSINLEAPCGQSLSRIAPEKIFATTLESMNTARRRVVETQSEQRAGRPRDPLHPGGAAGMTMQFVVGATPDSDRGILSTAVNLYEQGGVHHSQFSAFRPIRDTPMENVRATPTAREHRLYEADHLIRNYGFSAAEMPYDAGGLLPLALDPKAAWALAHPELFPVEIRTADVDTLLRVPGIGPIAARRIANGRRDTLIRSLRDLRQLGVVTSRAAGFLTLNGRTLQTVRWSEQLGFWAPEEEAGVHQMVYEVSPGTFR